MREKPDMQVEEGKAATKTADGTDTGPAEK
jgi:hypothetical protein